MAIDKKQVIMWTAGTLASLAAAFLIYRLQKRDAAASAANAEATAEAQAAQSQQEQSYLAQQPVTSVPTISASAPVTSAVNTAVDNGGSTPSDSSALETALLSLLSNDSSNVTSQSSPSGNAVIAALPIQTLQLPTPTSTLVQAGIVSLNPTPAVPPQALSPDHSLVAGTGQ